MKKPMFIIGKKQVVFGCMTAVLAVAVYINYSFAGNSESDNLIAEKTSVTEESEAVMYGDTVFVNADEKNIEKTTEEENTIDNESNYFAQARLNRDNSRDEAVATLQSVIGGGDISDDEMVSKAIEAVDMSSLIESESNIESLIKSLGFEDCIVYLSDDSAKVVVKTDELKSSQATAIKDIILNEISISAEKIRIFEIK
jgi:stage III sporulation protein AH